MKKQTFNRELVRAKMKEMKLNYKDLADEIIQRGIKISESAIKIWFRSTNPSVPELDKIKLLSEILSLSIDEILGNEKQQFSENSNSLKVEVLEMRAGFGSEGVLDPEFRVERRINLPSEFLGKINANYTKVIRCVGDSMSPEFNDSDFMLVEMLFGRDYVRRPGLYLVRLDNIVYIKRIEFLPNNDIKLISINPAYPTFTASSTGYEWEILGCVYGRISVKLSSGFLFSNQGVK